MTKEVMKLTRVKFSELREVEGAFGQEWVAPAGGGFPKHLIHSYDLKTKTVVFPIGWMITESGGTNEDNWKRTQWEFHFGKFCHTVLRHKCVKKIDFVEAEYNPDEFRPNEKLVLMTLRVPRRNKNHTDKLIKEHRVTETVVAVRSRESKKVIVKSGRKQKSFPQYLYELAIQKSEWRNFARQLYEKNLVPKKDRFAILVESTPLFPRQLAYFKDSN